MDNVPNRNPTIDAPLIRGLKLLSWFLGSYPNPMHHPTIDAPLIRGLKPPVGWDVATLSIYANNRRPAYQGIETVAIARIFICDHRQ